MSEYTKFDANVYSDETYGYTEEEYNAVMMEMAQESEGLEGYEEWSEEVEEAKDWQGGYSNRQDGPTHEGWAI